MTSAQVNAFLTGDQPGQLFMGPIKQIAGAPRGHPPPALYYMCVGCESADNKKSGHTEKEMAQVGRQYYSSQSERYASGPRSGRSGAKQQQRWSAHISHKPKTIQFFYTRLSSPYLRRPSLDL